MEPNELKPQDSMQENGNLSPEILPPKEAKTLTKKLILIIAAAIVALILGGLILSTTYSKQNNRSADSSVSQDPIDKAPIEAQAVEQVFVNPISGIKTVFSEEEYYIVKIEDTEYYGHVNKINDNYIRMIPTATKKGDVLTVTGDELHGPEAATYIKISSVTNIEALIDTAIIDALKSIDSLVSDATPSNEINDYIKTGQYQAYFFADGLALFAKTSSLDDMFMAELNNVYVLQTAAEGSAGATNVSLAKAKPEQYNQLTTESLLYWQNMKPDSQISTAATQYENQSQ